MDEYLVFFETSAINFFMRNFTPELIILIKKNKSSNVVFTTSQYVLWEILNTSDESSRENIIEIAQYLLDEYIMQSPIELIDKFIEAGCPLEEAKRCIKSSCNFGDIWSELVSTKEKTFVIDRDILKINTDGMYKISKLLSKFIKARFEIHDSEDELYETILTIINYIYNNLEFIREDTYQGVIDNDKTILYKTSIFFVLVILVIGNGFESKQYEKFWSDKNAQDDITKINYVLTVNEVMFHRGPFIEMAIMAISQLKNETNRGLYLDCLHAMYLPYVGKFYTNDKHFSIFVEGLGEHFENKISLLDDC